MRKTNITGHRFGRLVVVERCGADRNGRNAVWLCVCDCGGNARATTSHLRSGHTQSCGCLKLERLKSEGNSTRFKEKHGLSHARLHRIWAGMKSRCYNPNASKYHLWGGRGIKVCDEWLNDFIAFYDWAISNGYADDLSIDRIDNNGNYSPDNCRWATIAEQNRNRRCCKKVAL